MRTRRRLKLQKVFAVVRQLRHGLADIIQSLVRPPFFEARKDIGFPATSQLFQGTDIQITIVEVRFQLRHVLKQETTILPDAVAADRRGVRRNPLFQELNGRQLCCAIVKD